jgi:hypothetical protein
MSDPENFLARWARRKQAAAENADDEAAPDAAAPAPVDPERAPEQPENKGLPSHGDPLSAPAAPSFELATLPPIESITASTDIQAFLAPGVPAEITRAALRRAWAADPAIRNFVGLSENSWDFNAPGGIAGFGPLELTDELRQVIEQLVKGVVEARTPVPAAKAESTGNLSDIESAALHVAAPEQAISEAVEKNFPATSVADWRGRLPRDLDAAPQQERETPADSGPSTRRGHGRALPS